MRYAPEIVNHALEQARRGHSTREIQADLAELGVQVSHVTIARWLKSSPPAVAPELASRLRARQAEVADAQAREAELDDAPFDTEAVLQRMLREAQTDVRDLAGVDDKASQAAGRRAVEIMRMLAQLEKRKPRDGDAISFTKAEIAQGMAEVTAVLAELCSGNVSCSNCGKPLVAKVPNEKFSPKSSATSPT